MQHSGGFAKELCSNKTIIKIGAALQSPYPKLPLSSVRYCIKSASLRFIPYVEMKAEEYRYLLDPFE